MAKIAGELGTVDWKTLAGWLDIPQGKVDGIEAKCLRDGGEVAECYRINLVRTVCVSEGVTAEVAREKIAKTLEEMGNKLQASNLRQLKLGNLFMHLAYSCVYAYMQVNICTICTCII